MTISNVLRGFLTITVGLSKVCVDAYCCSIDSFQSTEAGAIEDGIWATRWMGSQSLADSEVCTGLFLPIVPILTITIMP